MRVDPLGFLRNSEEVLNHFLDMLCRFLEYTHDLWRNCCNLIALKKNHNPDVLLEHHLQSNMICKLASWLLPFSPSMSQKLCRLLADVRWVQTTQLLSVDYAVPVPEGAKVCGAVPPGIMEADTWQVLQSTFNQERWSVRPVLVQE